MSQAAESHDHDAPNVPRGALLGAGALIVFTLLGAGAARLWHLQAATPVYSSAARTLQLHFLDRPDGAIEIRDAAHEERLLRLVPPGTNGFLRGVMRGLARGRRVEHASPETPFTLVRWTDGQMTLSDPVTGERIALEVFGPTNAGVFASLLTDVPAYSAQGSSP